MNERAILNDLPGEIRGERVVLRPYRSGDGKALFEAVDESREHILPWLPWGDEHRTSDDSEAFVRRSRARWELREDLGMAICLHDGSYVGGTGLHRIDWEVPSFEVGYWIRSSAHGKGYITEAVQLLTRYAFESFGAKRVFIRVAKGNVRSAAVPRRCGYPLEATLRNEMRMADGELYDMLYFVMTDADWRAREGG